MHKTLIFAALSAVLSLQPVMAQDFTFNGTRLSPAFALTDTENHTVYQDQEVADTCYRSEQTGTTQQCVSDTITQCRTEDQTTCTPITRHECRLQDRQVCVNTDRQVCEQQTRQECTPIKRHECSPVSRQVCNPVTTQQCHDEQKCSMVPDEVCRTDTQGHKTCTPIQRHECHSENVCQNVTNQNCHTESENQCREVPDQVCRTTSQNVCHTVPDQSCHTESQNVCSEVPDQACRTTPQQVCSQVPHQSCSDVPVYANVPYACSKTVSVATGTELDFNVSAAVTVRFSKVPANVKASEALTLSLAKEDVTLSLAHASGNLLLLAKKQVSTATITGSKQKKLTANFDVTLIALNDVLAPIATPIGQPTLVGHTLKFSLGHIVLPAALDISMQLDDDEAQPSDLFNSVLKPNQMVLAEQADHTTQIAIDLDRLRLGVAFGDGGVYGLSIRASIKESALEGLLNPDTLPKKQDISLERREIQVGTQ